MDDKVARIIEQVRCIPVEKVIGQIIELHKKGSYYYGLCPFHNDTKEGSFVITPSTSRWKCFSCPDSPGGDAISFVAKYYNISMINAIFKIALEYNIINNEEYELYTGKQYKKEDIKFIPKNDSKSYKPVINTSNYILDIVYRTFIEVCGLSEIDRYYLIKERHVAETQLKDFFTMPKRGGGVMNRLIAKLKEKRIDSSVLGTIPGFFYNKKLRKWQHMHVDGIGFAIKDVKGNIIRLQIRKRNLTNSQRYIWFSSSFVFKDETGDLDKGTGAGSPIDITMPQNRHRYHIIAVTEGKFKAIALSNLDILTLSMQGVSNWKEIKNEVNNVFYYIDFYSKENTCIWICYDGDILNNKGVYQSAVNLQKDLESSNIKTLFVLWDKKYGKGIDDVLINGNKNKLIKMEKLPIIKFDKKGNRITKINIF